MRTGTSETVEMAFEPRSRNSARMGAISKARRGAPVTGLGCRVRKGISAPAEAAFRENAVKPGGTTKADASRPVRPLRMVTGGVFSVEQVRENRKEGVRVCRRRWG